MGRMLGPISKSEAYEGPASAPPPPSEDQLSSQRRLDILGQAGRGIGRGVAFENVPLLVDQKLGEVPLDRLAAQQPRRFGRQPTVQRIGVGAIDLNLGHHGETDAVIQLAKLSDLVVATGVLRAKLVAREAQHHQTLLAISLVQFFQTGKLRRESAGAGGVDDQHRLALELAQGNGFALSLIHI